MIDRHHQFPALHWLWMPGRMPYGLRVVLLVFVAAWVALLIHELAHALMARALGIRIWSISLGRGPVLWDRLIGDCRVRVALLPLHGEVSLVDQDAEALGYRQMGARSFGFEWLAGSSWRAPLITAAGSVANLLLAEAVLGYWLWMPRPVPPLHALSLCCFVINCMMFLNLVPIRGLDGWRMAVHAAAWRKANDRAL
jgi:membrane-associated protease RseP (regulator of RpoE activity)